MGKIRNLWSDEDGTKAVSRPQKVAVAKGWKVESERLPVKPQAPRRRKYAPIRPNNREAVATPLAGQSYNPVDVEHQAALAKAVRALEKKKHKDEKFVKMMTAGRNIKMGRGSFTTDKNWEEEVQETPSPPCVGSSSGKSSSKADASSSAATVGTDTAAGAKDDKRTRKSSSTKKKASCDKITARRAARRSLAHRRHPGRDALVAEADELDKIIQTHEKQQKIKAKARERRRAAKKENMQIKHYGRHYHTPLVVDVAPTDKLVGSLRHLSGGYVHPLQERVKSVEERNLVPARMRHTYNKRKILKPKGELRLKRETVGVLPYTDF